MVQINFASREVNCKIVYYGPGRGGKTTNLQFVHAKAPENSRGDLISIATETDRTLFFDFLPLDLGTVGGMRTKFQLYTVPGQVYYNATRKLVLQGCDGVVFVADSNPELMKENIESLDNLAANLAEYGMSLEEIPLVLQFNKRDLPNALPVAEMNARLNRHQWQAIEAVATNGDGVFQALKAISQLVIKRLNREPAGPEVASKQAAPQAAAVSSSKATLAAVQQRGAATARVAAGAKSGSGLGKAVQDPVDPFKARMAEIKQRQAASPASSRFTAAARSPAPAPPPKVIAQRKSGKTVWILLILALLAIGGAVLLWMRLF